MFNNSKRAYCGQLIPEVENAMLGYALTTIPSTDTITTEESGGNNNILFKHSIQ